MNVNKSIEMSKSGFEKKTVFFFFVMQWLACETHDSFKWELCSIIENSLYEKEKKTNSF